ncbi:MAG TPA: hypothetical protein VF101_11350 [Gaiellaceae bacterium]
MIRLRDSGKTFTIDRGRTARLRLSHATWRWSEPKVSSRAVRLVRVTFIRDPGYDEWVIRARLRGRALVSAAGQIPCTVSPCPPTPLRVFRVTIVVR